VLPSKRKQTQPEIGGTQVPRTATKLFDMISKLYTNALNDCDIDITFRHAEDGAQVNPCRTIFMQYAAHPTMANGRAIAERMQSVTTHRSGLGLLFVVAGDEPAKRFMLSRFPADEGVVAERGAGQQLNVQFLEQVFMKNAHAYKSVVYGGPLNQGAFWNGKAVDKQINSNKELSAYWISEFLDSELSTTGAAGTKRLAVAFRQAIRATDDPEVRSELMAAVQLVRGENGRTTSVERVAERLNLSDEAVELLRDKLPRPELFEETFRFSREEFDQHVAFRSVELDTGVILTADNSTFDELVEQREVTDRRRGVGDDVAGAGAMMRFTTEGRVVDERLRKTVR
jgi:hypothetical protein